MIDHTKIQSVYSGRNGRCCCGCAGKHTYASAFQLSAGIMRGYAVEDKEVRNATVKLICNKINAAGPIESKSGDHFYAIVGDRLYVAYKANS
jgi:hypothetical protein